MPIQRYNFIDSLIEQLDVACRTLNPGQRAHQRQRPDANVDLDKANLTESEKKLSANLLRVDHAGEVCAQALYHGQAAVAKSAELADSLRESAEEENDHLAWCEQRLAELSGRPSVLGPLWYGGSFMLGAAAGMMGDKWSLGFVVETEHQVMKHLDEHLQRLPEADYKSRVILQQMKNDEASHAHKAQQAGASNLPNPVRNAMAHVSKIMTRVAFWI